MKKRAIILIAIYLVASVGLVVLSPLLFRKRTVPLVVNDKVVAVAKLPLVWGESKNGVYVGKTKNFSLWRDF
jgi:hypothetical protein